MHPLVVRQQTLGDHMKNFILGILVVTVVVMAGIIDILAHPYQAGKCNTYQELDSGYEVSFGKIVDYSKDVDTMPNFDVYQGDN